MPDLNIETMNSQIGNLATDFANADLIIYSGPIPTNSDTSLAGNVVLAQHVVDGFSIPVNGGIVADPIASAVMANTGIATFARLVAGTQIIQLTVGVLTGEVILPTANFVQGETSQVSFLTIVQPRT